jgi:uncharacterized cupredoxin-like copper-binding protein
MRPVALRRAALVTLALAAVVLLAGRVSAGPEVATVDMTMRHSRFDPAVLEVDAGTTLRFQLRNLDPIDHELIVGDAAVHARHRVGRERHHHGQVPGEISVPAGAAASTTYRFTTPGRVAFACHLPGHEAYGMTGVVIVR